MTEWDTRNNIKLKNKRNYGSDNNTKTDFTNLANLCPSGFQDVVAFAKFVKSVFFQSLISSICTPMCSFWCVLKENQLRPSDFLMASILSRAALVHLS